jgi:hypothetical protein
MVFFQEICNQSWDFHNLFNTANWVTSLLISLFVYLTLEVLCNIAFKELKKFAFLAPIITFVFSTAASSCLTANLKQDINNTAILGAYLKAVIFLVLMFYISTFGAGKQIERLMPKIKESNDFYNKELSALSEDKLYMLYANYQSLTENRDFFNKFMPGASYDFYVGALEDVECEIERRTNKKRRFR